jgi:nucleoside-diphosphate-sugar epimerase
MRILILGCGWVGEEVAKYYISKGDEVYATCTSIDKQEHLLSIGCKVAVVNFDSTNSIEEFPKEFDVVLNSVPASSRNTEEEIAQRFENLKNYISQITYDKHIYLSSIGIYPDIDFTFDESYCGNLNNRLYIAEQKMTQTKSITYRLGGLFGKNRIFAKYFENRICTGDQPANFVHLDDVVDLIVLGFENDLQNSIYNIVAPEHPIKRKVIIASAKQYGFDLPSEFKPQDSFQKIVDGSRIVKEINYQFNYPSPLEF